MKKIAFLFSISMLITRHSTKLLIFPILFLGYNIELIFTIAENTHLPLNLIL